MTIWIRRGRLGLISTTGAVGRSIAAKWAMIRLNQMEWGSKCTLVMPFSKATLKKARSMGLVVVSHHAVKYIRVHFCTTQCTVRDCSSGLMVGSSSEPSIRERSRVMAPICGPMDKSMKVSSKTMSVVAQAWFTTRMERSLKAAGRRERSTEAALTRGPMAPDTSSTTLKAKNKEPAPWSKLESPLSLSSRNTATCPRKQTTRNKCSSELLGLLDWTGTKERKRINNLNKL